MVTLFSAVVDAVFASMFTGFKMKHVKVSIALTLNAEVVHNFTCTPACSDLLEKAKVSTYQDCEGFISLTQAAFCETISRKCGTELKNSSNRSCISSYVSDLMEMDATTICSHFCMFLNLL